MKRVAVFVDAGYLFGQGSALLTGGRLPRSLIALDASAAVTELSEFAVRKTKGAELLRIYWYDTTGFRGPTSDQMSLAYLDDVKLRLGLTNQGVEQQRIESLILADLIELARLGSISDAVLLASHEDLSIGVQIAQSYGVRVHLIELEPSEGSHSRTLLKEVDTNTRWAQEILERILSVRSSAILTATLGPSPASVSISIAPDLYPAIEKVVHELVGDIDEAEITQVALYVDNLHGVPPEFDGKLLGMCRAELSRDLTIHERRYARARFSEAVKARTTTQSDTHSPI